MKRFLSLVLLFGLVIPSMVHAQDDLTQTYMGDGISFRYPSGWVLAETEEGTIRLSNDPRGIDDEIGPLDVFPGVIVIAFSSNFVNTETISIKETSPEFLTGYYSGLITALTVVTSSLAGEASTVEISEIDARIINDKSAYSTSVLVRGSLNADFFGVTLEGPILINARTPGSEMQQWQSALSSIIESVELSGEISPIISSTDATPTPQITPPPISTSATGTRTDPIPLGEYYQFDNGRVRIVSIADPVPNQQDFYVTGQDVRVVGLQLEYICEITDPNESCTGFDVIISSIVLTGGTVLDVETTFKSGGTEPLWYEMEAFGGNTLSGFIFLEMPSEITEFESFRFLIDFDQIYFAPINTQQPETVG